MMTMATKKNIFEEHLATYLAADKRRKGALLTHVCAVTGLHRKTAVRTFRRCQRRDPGTQDPRGRPTVYGPDVTAALRTVWDAGNEVCGELLHPLVHEYIDILVRDELWPHSREATAGLRTMSEGTMKRRVAAFLKARRHRKGICATKPSHLKQIVPVFTGPWNDKPPGYGQIDTVMHSDTARGNAVYTVTYVDAATCLTLPRAQFNKGERATRDNMKAIQARMPFPWRGAHPDTGSEFLNWFVKDWCDAQGIVLSRSRPGEKNDNMYVEERNGHVVRKFIGYVRLDCPEAADALNRVYDVLIPYLLHFVAVRRMTGKTKILSRYRREYEKTPLTPYQRILEHVALSSGVKDVLRADHGRLNPLLLKREIERRIAEVYAVQQRHGTPRSNS